MSALNIAAIVLSTFSILVNVLTLINARNLSLRLRCNCERLKAMRDTIEEISGEAEK